MQEFYRIWSCCVVAGFSLMFARSPSIQRGCRGRRPTQTREIHEGLGICTPECHSSQRINNSYRHCPPGKSLRRTLTTRRKPDQVTIIKCGIPLFVSTIYIYSRFVTANAPSLEDAESPAIITRTFKYARKMHTYLYQVSFAMK